MTSRLLIKSYRHPTYIKLDAIMKKQGITSKELVEAEEKSDKKLESQVNRVQRRAEKTKKKRQAS